LAIASDGVSRAVDGGTSRGRSKNFTGNKTAAGIIRRRSEFGGGDFDEIVRIGCVGGGIAEPSVRTVIRSRNKIAIRAGGSSETSRTRGSSNDTGLTNISSGNAQVTLISIVNHKLETVVVRRIESEAVNVPRNFRSVFLNGGREIRNERKRIGSRSQIPRDRADGVTAIGRSRTGGVRIRGQRKGPGAIRVLARDGLRTSFPHSTDLLREVRRSTELPIAGSVGGVVGNVGNEDDGGHWARAIERGISRRGVGALESGIFRAAQIYVGLSIRGVENGTSNENIRGHTGRRVCNAIGKNFVSGRSGWCGDR
jgi:hypothetical protein